MTQVSNAIPIREGPGTRPPGGTGINKKSTPYSIVAADALLKSTDQYGQWLKICQKSDGLAVDVADLVVARQTLLEKSKTGEPLDHGLLDTMTRQLNAKGIFLAGAVGGLMSGTSDAGLGEAIVDVRVGKYTLSPAVMGYGNKERLFLPLGELAGILDFNIRTDMDQGRATGWFLSEYRTFDLDMVSGKGRVEGKAVQLSQDQFIAGENDLYVDAKVLETWFPIGFAYDFSQQSLLLDPKEELPFQARLARENARRGGQNRGPNSPALPLKPPEYSFIDPMFVDFGFSGSYEDDDDRAKGKYYALGQGDLGFMNSEVYATGDEKDHFDSFRLTLQREDPEGGLLGPLNATRVAAGDVRVPDFPLVGGGKYERGASVGNLPLNIASEYDTTFFAGNLAPGWEVEIYRNGMLIDNQRVGADGRYDFSSLPLYYGNNEFALKFYGPQGQEREETERIVIGSGMIRPGSSQYQVSVTQKDEKIFDPRTNIPQNVDKESMRFLGRYRYGLNKNMSLQGGILSQKINNKPHEYINIGAQGTIGDAYVSADYIHDTAGGDAVELAGQKKIGPLDLKIKQQLYKDFTVEGDTDQSNKVKSRTEISTFGTLKATPYTPDIPFSFNVKNTHKDRSDERVIGARFSAGIKNGYISNSVQWRDDTNIPETYPKMEGSTQATSQLGNLRLRTGLDYELHPDTELIRARISGLYNLTPELSTEAGLSHDLENEDITTGSLGMNWNNGKFILSPRVSYGSNDEFNAYLSFSTSFGKEPRSGKMKFSSTKLARQGAVSARAFLDKNNNKVFDNGDEPLSGVAVKADQAHKKAVTDPDGIAFITGLNKNRPTDITLEKETLEDPFWEPGRKGNSIMPRPGHVEIIDMPVITTGEIDGTLFVENGEREKKSLNHAPLQLLDSTGKVVQEIKSEYDGFYLFMKIPPGTYSVRLDPDFEKGLGTEKLAPIPVTIGDDGTVVNGLDLVFSPRPIPFRTFLAQEAGTPVADFADSVSEPRTSPAGASMGEVKSSRGEEGLGTDSAPEIRLQPSGKADTVPEAAKIPEAGLKGQQYGLHLSSYMTMEKAVAGIPYLKTKYKGILDQAEFTIQKTDLGPEKGVWYRILAGVADDKKILEDMRQAIQPKPRYAKVISLGSARGVHLSSCRTKTNAEQSIINLKLKYPDLLQDEKFTVKTVDLGPEKGVWHRVIAGEFIDASQARALAGKLKGKPVYALPMDIEKPGQFTVHTASYRTSDAATNGLKYLTDRLGIPQDNLSVRKTDLGEKGIWYRILLGRFETRQGAQILAASLKEKGFYAKTMDFLSAASI